MDGVIYCSDQSILTIVNGTFENINTIGTGTFIASINNYIGFFKLLNCIFKDSSSNSYFIYYELSSTLVVENSTFINNLGNMMIVYNSGLNITNSIFENNTCYYDFGCILNLQQFSNIYLIGNLFINITNSNEGGVFFISQSTILIQNQVLKNSNTSNYAACLLGESVEAHFRNFSSSNYLYGCLYFLNSSIIIENSVFQNTMYSFPENNFCFSSLCCFECLSLIIAETSFSGNINNTYYGGVHHLNSLFFYFNSYSRQFS